MIPPEFEVQVWTQEKLTARGIFPFNVFYTRCGKYDQVLGLTFFLEIDLEDFLDILDYKTLCDKSGYTIFPKSNTIILSGEGLMRLLDVLSI